MLLIERRCRIVVPIIHSRSRFVSMSMFLAFPLLSITGVYSPIPIGILTEMGAMTKEDMYASNRASANHIRPAAQ